MSSLGPQSETLLGKEITPGKLATEHALDIAATVSKRMKELGLTKQALAGRLGVSQPFVVRILHGDQSMTLKTLALLECALGIDISEGFRNPDSK